MSGRYSMHYSPSAGGSPQQQQQQQHHHHLMAMGMRPSSASSEHDKYLAELLAERQKLAPFMQVLPNCSHLLNQEIVRLTSMVGQSSFLDHDGFERESLLSPASLLSNGGALELNGWASLQPERSALAQTTSLSWNGATGGVAVPVIKKTLKIEVPVDKYPNFNFVGRLLGPRGNTLKRVEQSSGCRVMIRGRGSIKDTAKEEKMRDKLGHEHLYEPLHVLVEAELPASIIDTHLKYAREILQEVLKPPMDDSMDVVKKAQLRELAILNGTLREESPGLLTGTTSPFNNPGMKRPKTRQ